jgi:DnaK suppressor protein
MIDNPKVGMSPFSFKPYVEQEGEEYMNEAQLKHFETILNNWKVELMKEVDRTVHHMQDDAANFPDPNDRATQEIDESLKEIESGSYGFCESCGIEIGIRRLEARPTATLCIDCKTLDEIREKQMG